MYSSLLKSFLLFELYNRLYTSAIIILPHICNNTGCVHTQTVDCHRVDCLRNSWFKQAVSIVVKSVGICTVADVDQPPPPAGCAKRDQAKHWEIPSQVGGKWGQQARIEHCRATRCLFRNFIAVRLDFVSTVHHKFYNRRIL